MITATLIAASPRAAMWTRIFGGRTVQVESAVPQPIEEHYPDGRIKDFATLKIPLESLTPEQYKRLVAEFVAAGNTAEAVERGLRARGGCDINARDVFIDILGQTK